MPIRGPEGQEFEDFDACVNAISGDGTSQEEAEEICGSFETRKESEMTEDNQETFQATFDITKQDDEKQLVGGMILKSDRPDSDGDIFPEPIVEDFLHKFMIKSQQMGVDHEIDTDEIALVEAWTAKTDFKWNDTEVEKGDALGVAKIFDDELWEMAKEGQFNSFSIQGRAVKEKVEGDSNE